MTVRPYLEGIWHDDIPQPVDYFLLPRQCSAICMRLHRIWLTYNTCQYQNTPSGWCPPSALYNTGLFQDFAHPNIWFHHPVKKILQISKISIHSERLVRTFIIVGRLSQVYSNVHICQYCLLLFWFLYHNATRIVANPPGWDASYTTYFLALLSQYPRKTLQELRTEYLSLGLDISLENPVD